MAHRSAVVAGRFENLPITFLEDVSITSIIIVKGS